MATYLDLVNAVIRESGTDLDRLTSVNFAAPVDPMQERFKEWVKSAWRELQQERNEWQFRSKQAQRLISPRFLVVEGDRTLPPPVGATYEGDDTGATFRVLGVTTLEGTWAGGDATAWIDFDDYGDASIKWHEDYDEITPDPLNTDVFRMKWWGRYDLIGDLTDCLEPDLRTFTIQSTGGSTVQDNTNASDNRNIFYVPYENWIYGPESNQVGRGRPIYFTTTPEGYFDFYPRLDQQYVLTFTYSVLPQELSAYDDVVSTLPENYADAIKWRALMYYADYDDKPQVFNRAERRYESYKNRLERNQMPPITWAGNRYDNYYSFW